MSFVKKIKFLSELAVAKSLKKNIPFYVMFNITNRCNLRCKYCYGKFYDRFNSENELSTSQILNLIDELSILGTRRIAISGGEPLLRTDLPEIIDYLKSKDIECGIGSNGILVPSKINILKKVNSVCISLDGPSEIHDRYRGAGSWQAAITAIAVLKNNDIPVHVSTVLNKINYPYLPYLINLVKKKKFLLEISPLYKQFFTENIKDSPEPLSSADLKKAILEILEFKKGGYPIFYSERNYQNILNWPDYSKERIINEKPAFKSIKCVAGKYMCSIESNGDVFPCSYVFNLKPLNIKQVSFKKAFENIANHNCRACLWACYSESNLLLNINLPALLNQFKNLLFERKK